MPRNSQQKTFKSKDEEAAWWASREGRKTVATEMDEGIRKGTAQFYPRGIGAKRTDPAVLAELVARVNAKKTQAVSIRLASADIEAAKRLAKKAGIGYQTLLKELITEGLRRAS